MTQQDLQQVSRESIIEEQINQQLEDIKNGFPSLPIKAAASIEYGIVLLDEVMERHYIELWNQYEQGDHRTAKFVPVLGAVSHMLKNLYALLHVDRIVPTTGFEKEFFINLKRFTFYEELAGVCEQNEGVKAIKLIAQGQYKTVVENLLKPRGLNYDNLPKGLLLFHEYGDAPHTPMEEHLAEAALYASCHDNSYIHFTVLHQHLELFEQRVRKVMDRFTKRYKVQFHVSFFEQKPDTDTIAMNMDNTSFRNNDGILFFRSEGHGALIESLNDIDVDVVFIKNTNNVAPDRLKTNTVTCKRVIGRVLIKLQKKYFKCLCLLESGKFSHKELEEIIRFVQHDLMYRNGKSEHMEDEVLSPYLRGKLNRPLRVCGMVRDIGEPGGDPFITHSKDGTTSPQILGSNQIDKDNERYVKMLSEGTRFDPVGLVCVLEDHQGKPLNLPDFVDKGTGFISTKSKNGKELKALELPGLRDGAISNWNTISAEVLLSTFDPVRTANGLLREQHQP